MEKPYIEKSLEGVSHEQWLELRNNSIGGSEAPAICGLSEWNSQYEIWENKIGLRKEEKKINASMFSGMLFEDPIRNAFRHWEFIDNDDEKQTLAQIRMRENFMNKRVLREVSKPNAIYYSKQYPFIHANLDGLVNENGEEVLVEVKSIGQWTLKKYKTLLPPYHIVQLHHYMIVTGIRKAYLLVYVMDGTGAYLVYKFDYDEQLGQKIIEDEKNFWFKYVLPSREALKNNNNKLLVPPPSDGSIGLEKFLNESYTEDNGIVIKGGEKEYELAKQMKDFGEQIALLEAEKRKCSNYIKQTLMEAKADSFDFGASGKVTWKKNSNGIRMLRNNIN